MKKTKWARRQRAANSRGAREYDSNRARMEARIEERIERVQAARGRRREARRKRREWERDTHWGRRQMTRITTGIAGVVEAQQRLGEAARVAAMSTQALSRTLKLERIARQTVSKKREGGFTLIELLILLSIIGIIMVVVVGTVSERRDYNNCRASNGRVLRLFTETGGGGGDTAPYTDFMVAVAKPDGDTCVFEAKNRNEWLSFREGEPIGPEKTR